MHFELQTPGRVVFGADASRRAPQTILRYGRRVFLVTGAHSLERTGVLDVIRQSLLQAGGTIVRWIVSCEPDTHLVDEGVRMCLDAGCDAVLAIGGGSVLDAAKAGAALVTNGGPAIDYLEGLPDTQSRTIEREPLPLVAVPTTAGSGS